MEQSLANLVLRRVITHGRGARLLEPRRPARRPARARRLRGRAGRGAAARRPQGRGGLTMADGEKPTSIWKKEISFRRKPATRPRRRADVRLDAALEEGGLASGRSRGGTVEAHAETPADAVSEPPSMPRSRAVDLDLTPVAGLRPAPVAPPAEPPIEHDWLTKPLEEVSEPPRRGRRARARSCPSRRPSSRLVRPEPRPVPAPAAEPTPEPRAVPEPADRSSSTCRPADAARAAAGSVAGRSRRRAEPDARGRAELRGRARRRSARLLREGGSSCRTKAPRQARPSEPKPKREGSPRQKRAPKEERSAEDGAQGAVLQARASRSSAARRNGTPARPDRRADGSARRSSERPKPRPRPSLPTLPTLSRGASAAASEARRPQDRRLPDRGRPGHATASTPELVQVVRDAARPRHRRRRRAARPRGARGRAARLLRASTTCPKRGIRLGIANNRIGVRTFEVDRHRRPEAARERDPLPRPGGAADPARGGRARLPGALRGRHRGRPAAPARAPRRRLPRARRPLRLRLPRRRVCRSSASTSRRSRCCAPSPSRTIRCTGSERGALVAVSVGHDRSTFAVSDGRVCEFTRVLEWGGWSLNVAIARALDMSPTRGRADQAGALVRRRRGRSGRLRRGAARGRAGGRAGGSSRRSRGSSSPRSSSTRTSPARWASARSSLTGGTAHLPGLGAELERLIGVPVRVVDPLAASRSRRRCSEREQVGSLAVAIGLGIED